MKKSRGIPIASLPLHLQAQVRAQLHKDAEPTPVLDKMIRQSAQKLNKTEARFLEWLKERYPDCQILSQAVTLKLANGVRYTPDFFVMQAHPVSPFNQVVGDPQFCFAYETKGFMRDDAAVKIKFAAKEYPRVNFTLVWWDKDTFGWKFQPVLA